MTNSRSHRSMKARFILYSLGISFVIVTIYIYQTRQEEVEAVHRCRAEQAALAAQLRAIIEYKERMERSLTSIRNQLADTTAALHTREEEQMKLSKQHGLIQNMYSNLTQECTKVKDSVKSEQMNLKFCKSKSIEASEKYNNLREKYDGNISKLQNQVNVLTKINQVLTEKNQKLSSSKQLAENHHPVTSIHPENINNEHKTILKQVTVTEGIYRVTMEADETRKKENLQDVESNILNQFTNNTVFLNTSIFHTDDLKKIPQGVLPELPVEEHSNDKNSMLNSKIIHTNKIKHVKLKQNNFLVKDNDFHLKQNVDDNKENNKKNGNDVDTIINRDISGVNNENIQNNLNVGDEMLDQLNESKLELEEKKEDSDDIDNDRDDLDDYGYPRGDPGEESINK